MNRGYIFTIILILTIFSCNNKNDKLPILGKSKLVNGKTIHHQIPDFSFMDQDSVIISNESFKNKAYIANFFFVSCPTICPKVNTQMKRIDDEFLPYESIELLSHTLDARNDTIPRLKKYALNLEASNKWHFVYGSKVAVYKIAKDYFNFAEEDPNAAGGIMHSGIIVLVDKNRHIRSYCKGTNKDDVTRFISDVYKLIKEENILPN